MDEQYYRKVNSFGSSFLVQWIYDDGRRYWIEMNGNTVQSNETFKIDIELTDEERKRLFNLYRDEHKKRLNKDK